MMESEERDHNLSGINKLFINKAIKIVARHHKLTVYISDVIHTCKRCNGYCPIRIEYTEWAYVDKIIQW